MIYSFALLELPGLDETLFVFLAVLLTAFFAFFVVFFVVTDFLADFPVFPVFDPEDFAFSESLWKIWEAVSVGEASAWDWPEEGVDAVSPKR